MLGNVQVLSASFPVSPVRDGVRLVVHDRHRERSQPGCGADVHSGRNQPVLRGVVWRVCRETSVCLHERLRFRERETKVSKGEVRERVLFFSGRVHVWAVLREDAETSVRVWDFDDGMREWSVRERRRDIGVRGERGEYKDEGRSRRRDATHRRSKYNGR